MSAPTKAALLEENAQLRSQLDKGKIDANIQLKLIEQKRDALRSNATKLETELEAARNAAIHFRAQRDTLVGYVEGNRKDREATTSLQPERYGEPSIRTRTDEFLESMLRDPPSTGRIF